MDENNEEKNLFEIYDKNIVDLNKEWNFPKRINMERRNSDTFMFINADLKKDWEFPKKLNKNPSEKQLLKDKDEKYILNESWEFPKRINKKDSEMRIDSKLLQEEVEVDLQSKYKFPSNRKTNHSKEINPILKKDWKFPTLFKKNH
jgi:hypothetical protein